MNTTIPQHLMLRLLLADQDITCFMDLLSVLEFEVSDYVKDTLVTEYIARSSDDNFSAILVKLNNSKQFKGN